MFNCSLLSVVINRKSGNSIERMIEIHVFCLYDILRMEEYIIPYLKDTLLIGSELTAVFLKAMIADQDLKSYAE